MASKPDSKSFEQSLERLEEIVKKLEGGDLSLEKSIELFEEGVALGQSCTGTLDAAEKKITLLVKQTSGPPAEQPFDGARAVDVEAPPASRKAPAPRPARPRVVETPLLDNDEIPF